MSLFGTIQLKNRLGFYHSRYFYIQDQLVKYYRNENDYHLKNPPLGIFTSHEITSVVEDNSDGIDVICVHLLQGAFKLELRTQSHLQKDKWISGLKLLPVVNVSSTGYITSRITENCELFSALSCLSVPDQVYLHYFCDVFMTPIVRMILYFC